MKRAISKLKAAPPSSVSSRCVNPQCRCALRSGKSALWRLISHLSLNYFSLVEEGREAFQEILKLYNFTGSAYSEKQIDGITKISSARHFARLVSENGITFARGTRVELELDEESSSAQACSCFQRHRTISGRVRIPEQLQSARSPNETEKGAAKRMAPPRRSNHLDVKMVDSLLCPKERLLRRVDRAGCPHFFAPSTQFAGRGCFGHVDTPAFH